MAPVRRNKKGGRPTRLTKADRSRIGATLYDSCPYVAKHGYVALELFSGSGRWSAAWRSTRETRQIDVFELDIRWHLNNDLLHTRSKTESEGGSSPASSQPSGWAHPAIHFHERATGQEVHRRSDPTSALTGCQAWRHTTPKRCAAEITAHVSPSRYSSVARG